MLLALNIELFMLCYPISLIVDDEDALLASLLYA